MEQTDPWTFDVALSFAAHDRNAARETALAIREYNLSVFYDEWLQARIIGRDLVPLLREIYLKARLCVPFISANYIEGKYPSVEFQAIIERETLDSPGALFPVYLENVSIPALSRTIAYADYTKYGAKGIAALIAERLAVTPIRSAAALVEVTEAAARNRVVLRTHSRRLPKETYSVDQPELVKLVTDPNQFASAAMRARAAHELLTYVNWRHKAGLGIAYGAWRDGDRLLLSALPSLHAPQKTLEFRLDSTGEAFHLESEWSSSDKRYGPLGYWEWQPAVEGLTADRADLDLDREVAILILEGKGAEFGFPIVPSGSSAEKLCSWLREDPPEDYLEWGRDPRLVSHKIGPWGTLHHVATGIGVLVCVLHGRWSAPAFWAMNEALRTLLPSRFRLRIVTQGAVRICVFLSLTRNEHNAHFVDRAEVERDYLRAGLDRTYATIARMVAALRQLPVPPPNHASALPTLSKQQREILEMAEEEMGDSEYPNVVERWEIELGESEWIKLHQEGTLGLASTPVQFNFGDVITVDDLRTYLAEKEAPLPE